MPQSNKRYWKEKIRRNKERDDEVNREFKKRGWKVIRIWEYDVRRNLVKCMKKILKVVKADAFCLEEQEKG